MDINGYEIKDGVLDLSEAPVTKLENKLAEAVKAAEEAQAKAAAAKDDYLRLMAEFDTFRRRHQD